MTKYLIVTLIPMLVLSACSSGSKSGGSATSGQEAASEGGSSGPSNVDQYSLEELSAAANTLRVVREQAAKSYSPGTSNVGTTEGAARPGANERAEIPTADATGPMVLSCPITADQAQDWERPLKDLISRKLSAERDNYVADPSTYARTQGFETCGGKCSCGIFVTLLEPVREKSLKGPQQSQHRRFLTRLKAKAARQTKEESLTCARQQNWFCTSDLRRYVEANQ